MSDNMIEKYESCSFSHTIEYWHGFNPLTEVINNHNDVFMVVDRRRVTSHEVNFPFAEGTECDDMMCPYIWGKDMEIVTLFNYMDAIDKDGGPKINAIEYILSGIQTREVATTCSTMEVI